jgi:acetylornithine/succinyldiaminopimelate/putrescine aminotransferase
MGRTGRWFGFQHMGVVPDIVTLAKALGGGFPIGACVTTKEIAATFKPGMHGTTFGGNPLACAVARTVIETIAREGLVERAASLGERWAHEIRSLSVGHGVIKEVRGRGLMMGLEMGEEATAVPRARREDGVLVNVTGGKVVRLLPPLIIGDGSVARPNQVLKAFLDK